MLQRLWISGEGRTQLGVHRRPQNPKCCKKPLLMTEAVLFTKLKQPGIQRKEKARMGQSTELQEACDTKKRDCVCGE